jgi:hypothetical protein
VHPLEQLRYLARAWENDYDFPAQEVAAVLAELAGDSPASLVQACRRLIEYFASSGQAWWLSARVLSGGGVVEAIWEAADELASDPTGRALSGALALAGVRTVAAVHPSRTVALALRGLTGVHLQKKLNGADLVVLSARAAGAGDVLATPRAAEAASAAGRASKPVWVVVERGVLLPGPLWEQLVARSGDLVSGGLLSPADLASVVCEAGLQTLSEALSSPTCPPVAELLGWRH